VCTPIFNGRIGSPTADGSTAGQGDRCSRSGANASIVH
jgi:hypothetical protein